MGANPSCEGQEEEAGDQRVECRFHLDVPAAEQCVREGGEGGGGGILYYMAEVQ